MVKGLLLHCIVIGCTIHLQITLKNFQPIELHNLIYKREEIPGPFLPGLLLAHNLRVSVSN